MKLIRCNNGHFYDQDKFSSCPYCNGGNSTSDSMTEAFEDQVTMPLREPQARSSVCGDTACPAGSSGFKESGAGS